MKLTDENAETEDKCIFEEIRKIGAFSNETLIEGCKEAEILLQLKEAPKLEKLGSLATEIASIMGADYKVETDEENSTITGMSLFDPQTVVIVPLFDPQALSILPLFHPHFQYRITQTYVFAVLLHALV